MRTDMENLPSGTLVMLYPNSDNRLHEKPTKATYMSGYFHCVGSDPMNGPDYYFGDVLKYNHGFEVIYSSKSA